MYAKSWRAAALFFRLAGGYQLGAAHQKGAVRAITAPSGTPEIANPAAARF
jgi:hypothetical protein